MVKRVLKWRPVRLLAVDGFEYLEDELPGVIASFYKGELVDRILKMDRKKPISFYQAVNLASDGHYRASVDDRFGHNKGESGWHFSHFLDFISDQGFHIELTGDEFDSPASNSN